MAATSVLDGALPFPDGNQLVSDVMKRESPDTGRVGRWAAFVVPFAGYLVVGFLLALHFHSYSGDAQSRLANGFYVLFGRDPHLAAIGFVWNPLTSLIELPLILLSPVFPALIHEFLAANIMSALAMAGACYQLYRFFEDLDLGPPARWGLLACFALNPMIIYFGSNGLSEALFTFTLVASARHLCRWLRGGQLRSLVISGAWLGWAYMARNEAVGAACLATLVVLAMTYYRTDGPPRRRRQAAVTDAVLFAAPVTVAFVGWALVSWIIVGQPFEQLSSAYGTASQLQLIGSGAFLGATTIPARFRYVVVAAWSMAPFLPILAILAARKGWRSRDPLVLGVLSILGGVCAFEVAAYSLGQIEWAYRYVIYTISLSVMLAGCLAAPALISIRGGLRSMPAPWTLVAGRRSFALRSAPALLALALLLPGVISTGQAMLYTSVDLADQQVLNWVIWPNSQAARANPERAKWGAIVAEARNLDNLHLDEGGIMLDNFEPCMPQLVLSSSRPAQFTIPNDRDFKKKLGSPYQFGIRYFLVSAPKGYGSVDALNVEYPSLYTQGIGPDGPLATKVADITMTGCPPFRLFKLIPQSS